MKLVVVVILFLFENAYGSFNCQEQIPWTSTWRTVTSGPGRYRNNGFCIACPIGCSCPGDGDYYPCEGCPAGSYQSGSHQAYTDGECHSPCIKCPLNYYCLGTSSWGNFDQMLQCSLCSGQIMAQCTATTDAECVPTGYYFNGSSILPCRRECELGDIEINPCQPTDRVCLLCQPGSFAQNRSCQACEHGFYCNNNNKYPCPERSTSPPNATSYKDCYCNPGSYGRVISPDQAECTLCARGTFCPGINAKTACNC